MYGLAGLRIGSLAGAREVVDVIRRTCVVYSVNGLAQEAALRALDDPDHVPATRRLIRQEKQKLVGELERMGLQYVAGEGNFVMIRLPINDALAYRKLITHGIMVRCMTGFRFPNWIRVTLALPDVMQVFVTALREILQYGR